MIFGLNHKRLKETFKYIIDKFKKTMLKAGCTKPLITSPLIEGDSHLMIEILSQGTQMEDVSNIHDIRKKHPLVLLVKNK